MPKLSTCILVLNSRKIHKPITQAGIGISGEVLYTTCVQKACRLPYYIEFYRILQQLQIEIER